MSLFCEMASIVPAGVLGEARIIHDTPDDFTIMRANMRGMPLEKRTYTRLFVNNALMMTDADFERRSNTGVVIHAEGDALIAGLGIGLILKPILANPKVSSVTVIEKSADVIALVGPRFACGRLKIIHADIFGWKPERGRKFDCIYFDIWPNVCTDNLEQMATLHRRFCRSLKGKRWMNSWCREDLRYMKRRGQ